MEYESNSLLGCSRLTHYHSLHVVQNTFDPRCGRKRIRVHTVEVKQPHKTSGFTEERVDVPGSIVSAPVPVKQPRFPWRLLFQHKSTLSLPLFKIQAIQVTQAASESTEHPLNCPCPIASSTVASGARYKVTHIQSTQSINKCHLDIDLTLSNFFKCWWVGRTDTRRVLLIHGNIYGDLVCKGMRKCYHHPTLQEFTDKSRHYP